MPVTPDSSNSDHLGDGVYATFDGYGVEIRVNTHLSPMVAYFEPSVVAALPRFLERMQQRAQAQQEAARG